MTRACLGWVAFFALTVSAGAFAKDSKEEDRFEQHRKAFADAGMKACGDDLNADVIDLFTRKKRDPAKVVEELQHPTTLTFELPNAVTMKVDISDRSGDPTDAIRYLGLVKSRPIDASILEVRKYGLRVFGYRIEALRNGKAFEKDEVQRFANLLYLSVRDIYFRAEVSGDLLAPTLQILLGGDDITDNETNHQFISAILAGVNIRGAISTNPYFKIVIDRWVSDRNHLGMSSPYDQEIVSKLSNY